MAAKTQIFTYAVVNDGEPVVHAESFRFTPEQLKQAMDTAGETPTDKIEMVRWMYRLFDAMEDAGAERLDIAQRRFYPASESNPPADVGSTVTWG